MSKHTPGPWEWEKVEGGPDELVVTEWTLKGPDALCRYWYDNPPTQDAKLIAAAPDLLTALEELVDWREAYGAGEKLPLDKARAAIKKATGGS